MRVQRLCGLLVMARTAAAAALTFTSTISNYYMCSTTETALLQWSGGVAPYTVQVVLGDETTYVVETLATDTSVPSGTWTIDLTATEYLAIKITDSGGSTALSNAFYLYPCQASSSSGPSTTSIGFTSITTLPTTSPTVIITTPANNTSTARHTITSGTNSSATASADNQDTSADDSATATALEPTTSTSTIVVGPGTSTSGPAAAKDDGGSNTAAIAGGAAGGGVVVLLAFAVVMWMWRRRNRRKRDFDIDEFTTGIDGIGGGGAGGGGKGADYMEAAVFRPTPYPSQPAASHSASGLVPGLPPNTSLFAPPVHASQAYAGGAQDVYAYPAGAAASDMMAPSPWNERGQPQQQPLQQQPVVWANRDSMATTMTAVTNVSGPGVSWQPAPGQLMAPTWPAVPSGANGHSATGSISGVISGPNGSVPDVNGGGSGVLAAPTPANAKEQEAFAATRAAQEAAGSSSASPVTAAAMGSTQDLFAVDAEDAALAAGGQLPPSYRPEWEERRRQADESQAVTAAPAPTPEVVPTAAPAPVVAAPVAPAGHE